MALTDRDILERAARALGKVDYFGPRGLTLISSDEIEAMCLALVLLGLVAVPPTERTAPKTLVIKKEI